MARTKFSTFQYDARFQDFKPGRGVSDDGVRSELEYRDQALEDYLAGLMKQLSTEFGQGARPIYADLAERDADARTKLAGQTCYVIDQDAEYIWSGSAWKLHNYPVLAQVAKVSRDATWLQNATLGDGTLLHMIRVNNGFASVDMVLTLGATSAVTPDPGFYLPYEILQDGGTTISSCIETAIAVFFDGSTRYYGRIALVGAGAARLQADFTAGGGSGNYLIAGQVTAALPFAFGTGDSIQVSLTYPIEQ